MTAVILQHQRNKGRVFRVALVRSLHTTVSEVCFALRLGSWKSYYMAVHVLMFKL